MPCSRLTVRFWWAFGLTVAVFTSTLVAPAATAAAPTIPAAAVAPLTAAKPERTITVNGRADGPVFQGAGAVSAGASSRLLHDYPDPQRGQLLDYLFRPGYGAQLQVLKTEIGSETNSTSGSEPSHERERGQVNCGRGYEWWLMREARKRNPDIKLAALAWGAPGWQRGGFWSQDNIDYQLRWLDCAAKQGLKIDYLGGWNERGYEPGWYVRFAKALAERHPQVRLIGADECCRDDLWRVADSMHEQPAFRAAVDQVGVHFACGHRASYRNCHSTANARSLGKPLWLSENSALTHKVGAAPNARALNRSFLDAGITGYMTWSAVSAWYANLPIADTGLLLAEWPWSGHYELGKDIWAFAHTTQFARQGWHYLRSASGRLAEGSTYVTRAAPNGRDYSTVIETTDAKRPSTIALRAVGGASTGPLSVWSSDLRSDDDRRHFVRERSTLRADGRSTVTLRPGHVYTITTSSGGGKGAGQPGGSIREQFPLPLRGSFEGSARGTQARYFSDVNGSFETVRCAAGRGGNCYQQQTPRKPVRWSASGEMDPTTLVGDPRWWGDYEVSAKVLLRQPGSAELLGRVSTQATNEQTVGGYFLRVSSGRGWQLYSDDEYAPRAVLASGPQRFRVGTWHDVTLRMLGSRLTVLLDGRPVATVTDGRQHGGNVGLRAGGFRQVQFDDVTVRRTAPPPRFVPQQSITATASSHSAITRGYDYQAGNAIDGRPESVWRPGQSAQLPESITLNLDRPQRLGGMVVQPQYDIANNAPPTRYRVLADDGRGYRQIAAGRWAPSWSGRTVPFAPGTVARSVRLELLDAAGEGGSPGIGEVNLLSGRR